MDIDKLTTEILPKSKLFFESIEDQFNYREKHYNKYRILNVFTVLSLIFMVMSLIPASSYFMGETELYTNKDISIWGLNIDLGNFFIRWILLALISSILYFVFRFCDKIFERKEKKYTLKHQHLNFALLYKTIKVLEVFLINGHDEQTKIASKYLKRYYRNSFTREFIKITDEGSIFYLPKLLHELKKESHWVTFSPVTENIYTAFLDFENKITDRINNSIEIDVCIELLNILLSYEYLQLDKVIKDENISINSDLSTVSTEILDFTASKLKSIDIKEVKTDINKTSTINRLQKFKEGLLSIFSHRSIIVTFFSWLILLSLIVTGAVYFGIKVVKDLKLDGTIFIGAVSIVLLGALGITGAIYSKKGNSNSTDN